MGYMGHSFINQAYAPRALWLALLLFGATPAVASEPPAAVVDGVVMPAWLERAGKRQPVAPGMVLQERDRIETGTNARILLTLPEGSKIKLGEKAQLGFDTLMAKREGNEGNIFLKSALRVATGAFRFTTNALAGITSRRDVSIRLATVTAGIRGTDLWGKQGGDKEIVCLLEGKIEVARDPVAGQSSEPITMDQPLQFYIAPKDQPALPLDRVPDDKLALWAAETEITRDAGGTSLDGQWKISFDKQTTFATAIALYEELRNQGYAAQFYPDRQNGKRIFRVELQHLSSEGDARALVAKLVASTKAISGTPSVSR
jgi:hypothetical protein